MPPAKRRKLSESADVPSDVVFVCKDGEIPFSWYILWSYPYWRALNLYKAGEQTKIVCNYSKAVMLVICHYLRFEELTPSPPDGAPGDLDDLLAAVREYKLDEMSELMLQRVCQKPTVTGLLRFPNAPASAYINFVLSGQVPDGLPLARFGEYDVLQFIVTVPSESARKLAEWYQRYGPKLQFKKVLPTLQALTQNPFALAYLGYL